MPFVDDFCHIAQFWSDKAPRLSAWKMMPRDVVTSHNRMADENRFKCFTPWESLIEPLTWWCRLIGPKFGTLTEPRYWVKIFKCTSSGCKANGSFCLCSFLPRPRASRATFHWLLQWGWTYEGLRYEILTAVMTSFRLICWRDSEW